MKRNLMIAAMTLGMAVATGLPAAAQDIEGVSASIPFAFTVGQAKLPAGHYLFTKRSGMNGTVLEVQSDSGRAETLALMTPAQGVEPANETALIFRKVGGQDFLEKVEVAGMLERLELTPPRAEKKLEHDMGIGMLFTHPAKSARS